MNFLHRWRQRRRPLIDAQLAIFANQERDKAAGVTWETDEYIDLHKAYYKIADREPWWVTFGIWGSALTEHERAGQKSPWPRGRRA